jgi:hypothetical protein
MGGLLDKERAVGKRCVFLRAGERGFDLREEAVEGAGADVVEGVDFGAELLGKGEVKVG